MPPIHRAPTAPDSRLAPRLGAGLTAALLVGALATAQCPPGAVMPHDLALETDLPATGPARTRMAAGAAALAKGTPAAARPHLLAALEFHPSSAEVLLELVCACGDDADQLARWLERYARAAADERGRVKVDGDTRRRLKDVDGATEELKAAQALTQKRSAAIAELARFIDKQKPRGRQLASRALLVRWASEALLEVAEGAPGPLGKVAGDVAAQQAAFEPDYDTIYAALAAIMRTQRPAGDGDGERPTTGPGADATAAEIDDRRVRAARILVGLDRQTRLKDLQGPRPDGPGKLADEARSLLADERARDVDAGKIWTIAELEEMSPEERERFTEEHRDWHHPGLATSTTGRYRIETTCGHETLLGVARTVELHHERLIAHYGKDPFEGRPGVVRVVPGWNDMETEGAPFWWAGGFQGGDRTTVRFAWGRISGLGRTLTHELTHRFDGALRPFLPSWYSEGHAEWTGSHYGAMADREFAPDWLRVGRAAHTYYKGYGGRRNFERLLKGEIEDYRDNYFAGYSLYTFLRTYPPTKPRYAAALPKFERNARGGQRDPMGYFAAMFCDGKDGRPADLDELFEDWRTFVKGCYDALDPRSTRPPWLRDYGDGPTSRDEDRTVLDEPTWSWERSHAEPFYGQEHAAAAALLLAEVHDHDGAIAAGVWSLTTDGWRAEVAEVLTRAVAAARGADVQAALSALARAHFPETANVDGAPLLAALPKTRALLDALATRAAALAASARPEAAAVTAREHAALADLFGAPPVAEARADAAARVPRHLGGAGFTESGLTDYEDRRHEGLWYVTPTGDLHVGREKPREATGVLDRRAHQRDAFAHSVTWLEPGHYVVRGRVHWTTSFVSGAIVFGHTRRDRGLRLGFRAGDRAFAQGLREDNRGKGRVTLTIGGLWERDGKLPMDKQCTVELPEEQNWFPFELHVRGPRVEVRVGEETLRYAVHDGSPIEGRVGFAVSTGAIRVQQPTVQRLDDELGPAVLGLDVGRQPRRELDELMGLQTRGFPTHHDGTLVLWLPKVDEGSPADRLGRAIRPLSKILQSPLEYPQPWVLAVPEGMDGDELARVVRDLQDLRPGEWPVVEHRVAAPFVSRYPWVLFLDGRGVLRAAADSRDTGIRTRVDNWSRKHRGR